MTRRQALGLGAAAVAAGSLRAPRARSPRGRRCSSSTSPARAAQAAAAGGGWRTTPVLRAPRRFDLVGLRWARGSRAEAQVRARRRGGGWTPWVALHPTGDHGPDRGPAAPAGTDPAFTGAADEFQLRLRGQPRALRARFVRALPTATVARRVTARLRRRARSSARARASQAPRIITRTEWGGDSVPPRSAPDYGDVQLAFVHHTVTANDYAPEDSPGIVLGICRYHRDSNRWNDIGYNFLVDQYGQVFEGRAGGMEAAVVGAQAQGYNSVSTGVACLGTFSQVAQSEAGLEALAQLLGWKLSLHGVPVHGQVTVASAGGSSNRYPSGTPVTFERISGHRDGDQTSCPGDVLYGQLADLRARAARYAFASDGLTVRAASSRIRGAKPVAVSGELRFADGSSPAGAGLDVEFQSAGSAWTRMGGAICGADGRWAACMPLPSQRPRTRRVRRRRGPPATRVRTRGRHRHPQPQARGVRHARAAPQHRHGDGHDGAGPADGHRRARAPRRLALDPHPAPAHPGPRRRVRHHGPPAAPRPLPRRGHRRRAHAPPPPDRALAAGRLTTADPLLVLRRRVREDGRDEVMLRAAVIALGALVAIAIVLLTGGGEDDPAAASLLPRRCATAATGSRARS